MRGQRYQILLILLGVVSSVFLAAFLYRELFPEYKIYQDDYIALERFRSTYSGQPPAPFQTGVKQIVFEREDKGPPKIDRCITCHVATQIPQFSPTKIVHDKEGAPIQVPNEEYVWGKLEQKIVDLRDPHANAELEKEGKGAQVKERLWEANRLESLKTAEVDGRVYDVTKVLSMHPLIGKETRPFEFHPLNEYGCTTCHGGNGRGLTTEKAHGPVFDGQYDTEYMGPRPEFTEKDPENDPQFASVFNSKPGDSLLFQTTPILPGALIQSSCIQCHKPSTNFLQELLHPKGQNEIERLTENYHEGELLFLAQACYACHRIAGLARGGIGPELTRAGNNYPWYLKQKIVWPQGDLKTSTMPNMHLDSQDLEDLLTFLLAQKGPSKAVSDIGYMTSIKAWEEGRKAPWEEPVPPSQIHNLRDSMTIFATQGCAACHRLHGFESNVGFKVEKEKTGFEALYREQQWFQSLIKEDILGSELVKILESKAAEIDQHVADNVREGALLEEIEKNTPGIIESMYANFRYAARAKNHHFAELAAQASPEEKQRLLEQQEAWKKRVHRVLMVYIQQYGFGHLVGPRPNWSGVYRSDEWLMEHFRNPAGHVPKSIMPIFPFDESKFYALTYMLDILGIRNRDQVHAIWKLKGFDPSEAFQIHCSQCHGSHRQGNGPVAEWIYPIPKNLGDPAFMLNLTRQNAIDSITYGVKGTPMPPWGEAPSGKPEYNGEAVLNKEEIEQLVDWLFSMIPGASSIYASSVPKWRYEPSDIEKELQQESGIPDHHFESRSNGYYINKKFYTEENIEAGKQFFNLNCAVCHGTEADGSGIRASVMEQAKPRMLTNLDWLNSRDDLRLLRSIKYGVAGTAMTPWGDLTSALQRIQLVVYIRSLSEEKELRDQLAQAIYQAFDQSSLAVETARIKEFKALKQLRAEAEQNQQEELKAFREAEQDPKQEVLALELYKKQIGLAAQVKKAEQRDKTYQAIKTALAKEKELYTLGGNAILAANLDGPLLHAFFELIDLNDGYIAFEEGALKVNEKSDSASKREALVQQIEKQLAEKNAEVEKEISAAEARIRSPDRDKELHELKARLASYNKVKEGFLAGQKDAEALRKEEEKLIKTTELR
jgi:mono/diheme cytochrome c family protein